MRGLPPPDPALRAVVVVPARDEQALVGRCLEALAAQVGLAPEEYEVILVLASCRDDTEGRARAVAAAHPGLRLHVVESPLAGAGPARAAGLDAACARLLAVGRPEGLVAGTDADSVPAPDWLRSRLDALEPRVTLEDERLARDLALAEWIERRSFRAADYTVEGLMAAKSVRVSAVLPSREVAATIGGVLDALRPLGEAGLLDEVVVVDADSRDGTVEAAAERGVRVEQESELMREFGPARGKGDAMWRALSATDGDVVVYLDTDTEDFDPAFAVGLLGPILTEPGIALVKGAFRRPFRRGEIVLPDEGGRVTELVARPLLNLLAPELAGFRQPLAGEVAARRDLLEAMPFPVGYGVETAMLMDACRLAGPMALAEVDLGTRQNRHQPLRSLTAMAYAVIVAGLTRGLGAGALEAFAPGPLALPGPEGLDLRSVPLEERPPMAGLREVSPARRPRSPRR